MINSIFPEHLFKFEYKKHPKYEKLRELERNLVKYDTNKEEDKENFDKAEKEYMEELKRLLVPRVTKEIKHSKDLDKFITIRKEMMETLMYKYLEPYYEKR